MNKQHKGAASFTNPSMPYGSSIKTVLHRLLLILCLPLAFAGSVSSAVAQSWTQVPNSGAVTSAAVLASGTIIGVGMDKGLWTRATLTSDWKQVPNSGAVIGVAAMPNGLILGVCVDNTLQTQSKDSLLVANASSASPAKAASDPAPCTDCPPWVSRSSAGSYLPLAAKADIWSNPKPFNRATGQMTVQSRFTRQKGTTCEFDVQFNNVGSKSIDEGIIVNRPGKAAVSAYDHVIRIRLNPGASYAFGTEVRECPLNWGETKDMTKCASCQPIVYFVAQ